MLIGYGPGTKDVNKYNLVFNNHIHHCGQVYPHSHGIVLSQSGENRIANNDIHDMPRKAICLCGVRMHFFKERYHPKRECARSIRWQEIDPVISQWNQQQSTVPYLGLIETYLHTRNNMVEYNEVARCLQKLGDGAAINVSGSGTGNVIRRNYVHDMYRFGGTDEYNGGNEWICASLRCDSPQRETLFTENVIANSNIPAFELQSDNAFTNNVIVNVDVSANIERTGILRVFRGFSRFEHAQFEKNIFINTDHKQIYYFPESSLREMGPCSIDYNIYYNPQIPPEKSIELQELKSYGHDKHRCTSARNRFILRLSYYRWIRLSGLNRGFVLLYRYITGAIITRVC